jgi:hypothetical protein
MPREANLFEVAKGSVLEGYFLLRERGANIPPMWIDRASKSRRSLHKELARILKKNDLKGLPLLRNWEERYKKECFYYGIRVLLELDRKGKTRY